MKRAALFVLLLSSCAFTKKHPAITTGIVAGSIGFTSCWIAVEKLTTCSAIGGGVGIALGGITGLVTTFADTGAHELPADPEEEVFVRQVERPDAGMPLPDAPLGPPSSVPPSSPVDAAVP